MPRPMTLDDVLSFPYSGVDECDLSPDGRRVAYTHLGNITIFDLEQWRPLASFEGNNPKWSPADSDVLAYLKSSSPGIFIRRMDGTERHLGENAKDISFFEWSFEGQFLALVVTRELEKKEEGNDESVGNIAVVRLPSPTEIVIFRPSPPTYASSLVVLDINTGEVAFQAESDAGETYEQLTWHPSGNWLTVISWRRRELAESGWRLFDIDLRDGRRKSRVGPGKNEIGIPKWSPDGKKLALRYSPYSGEVRLLCAMMEADSHQVQILSDEYFIDSVYWSRDSRKIFCSGLKGISRHVFCVDTVSGRSEVVADRTGWTGLRGISQDGRTLLTKFSGLKSLSDIYIIFLDKGQSKAVTHFSDQLAEIQLSNAEVVEWPSYDGLKIQGVIVPPLGKSMNPEHPTIVDLHGGPVEGGAAIFFRSYHWWAAEGFQVFAPDFRGSQQYQWIEPPTEEMDYKDVMSGIHWLASQRMCDTNRMVVHGFSYGAILGAYTIGNTTLFRAAVLAGGAYGGYRWAWRLGLQMMWNAACAQDQGRNPLEFPDVHQELAPIIHAKKVETPVLLLHGENDDPIDAAAYASYLRAFGKEVEFILYKGEGHGFRKKSHRKDAYERALRWFHKYLIE